MLYTWHPLGVLCYSSNHKINHKTCIIAAQWRLKMTLKGSNVYSNSAYKRFPTLKGSHQTNHWFDLHFDLHILNLMTLPHEVVGFILISLLCSSSSKFGIYQGKAPRGGAMFIAAWLSETWTTLKGSYITTNADFKHKHLRLHQLKNRELKQYGR